MRKVLFLMFLLFLMGLEATNIKAQVRIGGNAAPNAAAVLDLNADDSATPTGNKGALALPRVSLTDTLTQLNGATPITGMLVYNTNASMTGGNGTGVYLWSGSKWRDFVTLPSNFALPVMWSIVFDSNVTFTAMTAVGDYRIISATTIALGDVCVRKSANFGENVSSGAGAIIVVHLTNAASGTSLPVICYRPYRLN